MKSFIEANLTDASLTLAVANTPLFLLRKLKADPTVHEIAASFDGAVIVREISRLVCSEVRDATDYVRPYVYLAALSFLPDIRYLRAVAEIKGTKRWDWFDYINRVLLDTYIPTEHMVLPVLQKQNAVATIQTTGAVSFETFTPKVQR
jgi:hypothetical protein